MVLQNEKNIEKRISKVELTCTALRDENKEIRKELASLKHKQQEEHKEKEDKLKGKKKRTAEVPAENEHHQPPPINYSVPSVLPMLQQPGVPPIMWAPIMYPWKN